ncbi:MAG: septum formation initiator family protein [Candidatus Berkelbacteria bacterium]|nr:MAG: septum formation initiator family protein [Candidatus Berkelbacteria bacterium]QQG51825.1 MAG: septum formation initiator family protein [Candidatus Berkelbacteria bacterium]
MVLANTQKLLGRILVILLVVFALYSNVRLIIRNNKLHERLSEVQTELTNKELRNKKMSLLIAYYQSPSYQDVEARRRLGLKLPDETVMQVRGVEYSKDGTTLEDTIYENTEVASPTPPTNFSRWWGYFFGS